MESSLNINFIDYAIILIYFVFLFVLAIKVTDSGKYESSQDYFLAGKKLGWFLVGSSIFASNIGSEHLIGLAGAGATTGVPVAQFEILACFILLLLGWFFVPFYVNSNVATVPEFLERRFSKAARDYLTYISIISYVLTKISVTIYAGAIVFEAIGIPFWIGATIVVLVTGIYTIIGGLKAVIYTDAIQMFVMVGGSILVTIFGLVKIGGLSEISVTLGPEFLSLWRSANDPDFPWTGIIFGAPILGIWYWCTDQYIVQRTLSALDIKQARKGSIFAGYLKILPLFIFVFPGMIALVLSKQGYFAMEKNDMALPMLAGFVLPTGAKGLFIAGLLSALMSSLSSVFNSCSTLITFEIFKRKYPNISDKKLISIGRWSTVFLVIFGVLWIPMMKLISGELFNYIQSVQAYISPPIAAVFFLGLLFPFINSKGAVAALYSGLVLGILRLVLEILKVDLGPAFNWFYQMNFLHFAFMLFIFSSVLMLIISSMSKEEKSVSQNDLLGSTSLAKELRENKFDLALSLGLVALVVCVWIYFS